MSKTTSYMKPILLTVILLNYYTITAQSPPNGTIWHYNQYEGRSKNGNFFTYKITGDTSIGGSACKIIKGGFGCAALPPEGEVLKYEGKKVSRYDKRLNTFRLLYDFGAKTGDTLKIVLQKGSTDFTPIRVDSMKDIQIGNEIFRIQYLKQVGPPYYYAFGGEAVERAGCTFNFFPQYAACDPIQLGGLRCYQEAGKAFFKLVEFNCDAILNATTDIINSDKILIFPTPSVSELTIDFQDLDETIVSLDIVSALGQRVFQRKNMPNKFLKIDINSWQSGFYSLILKNIDGKIAVKRFVKLN